MILMQTVISSPLAPSNASSISGRMLNRPASKDLLQSCVKVEHQLLQLLSLGFRLVVGRQSKRDRHFSIVTGALDFSSSMLHVLALFDLFSSRIAASFRRCPFTPYDAILSFSNARSSTTTMTRNLHDKCFSLSREGCLS